MQKSRRKKITFLELFTFAPLFVIHLVLSIGLYVLTFVLNPSDSFDKLWIVDIILI